MKKKLLASMLLSSALLLVACGGEEASTSDKPKEEPKAAEQKEVSNEPEKDENGTLVFTEAGQKGKAEGGNVELLKIKDINESIDISPLKVTVKDIKLFKITDVVKEFAEELSYYTDATINDQFVYVQIQYDAENTEEKNIEWYGLTDVVTDKGQQIDAISNDFVYTDADGDSAFLGKVKKEFTDAFIVKDEDVAKLKMIFGSSMDADTYEDITAEQQVEYSF
ncbi:Uncharacterised protein [Mycobacteroides abscessus subsp. abscessus]|nr:Uncharacterised protein [Mycobacteroides abscessus subsp. abscessus]